MKHFRLFLLKYFTYPCLFIRIKFIENLMFNQGKIDLEAIKETLQI